MLFVGLGIWGLETGDPVCARADRGVGKGGGGLCS